MGIIRKTLIASAVSMAWAGVAYAGAVTIDVNGTGQGANANGIDQFTVQSFTWNADNLLIRDTTPSADAAATTSFYAQARLSSASGFTGFNNTLGTPAGTPPPGSGPLISGQWTYQLRVNVGVEIDTPSTIKYNPESIVSSFFDVFYQPTLVANQVSGCGYGSHQTAACAPFLVADGGAGILVMSGNARITEQLTLTQSGTAVAGLDNFVDTAGDVDNGVSTRTLQLTPATVAIDVTFINPAFILSNIISITTDLNPDLQHTETGITPFSQANPSDEVVGNDIASSGAALDAAYGTDRINNIGAGSCPQGGACDVHMQTNPSTSVITALVPEPGTVALLGLGLAGFGVSLRRRAKSITA